MKITNDGEIRFGLQHTLMVISLFALSFFALSDSPIGSIFVSPSVQCLLLMMLNMILLFNLIRTECRLRPLAVVFLTMSVFIFINPYFPLYSHYLQCFLLAFLVALNAYKWNEKWVQYYLNLSRVGYWFYAIVTVVCYFVPSVYYNLVLPFFAGSDRYASLVRTFKSGFMPGFTVHYSINGMYLVVGFMIAAILCFSNKFKKYKFETCFMLFALLLTGKRAHMLFGLAACFLMYCVIKLPENIKGVMKIFGIIVTILIAFVILINTVPALQNFMSRFDTKLEDDASMGIRFQLWGLAISLFVDKPLTGIGWGQFRVFAEKNFGLDMYTHNVYLELLCETGIIGALIFYGFFIVTYVVTIKLLYNSSKHKMLGTDKMKYVMFSFVMQSFFLMYCFTGNPILDRIMYIPYFVSCAIVYYYRLREKRNNKLLDFLNGLKIKITIK